VVLIGVFRSKFDASAARPKLARQTALAAAGDSRDPPK
jgi:hypothetical protein